MDFEAGVVVVVVVVVVDVVVVELELSNLWTRFDGRR